MTEETAPRPAMATAAELGANQCAVTDSEAGRCVFPAGHGRVIEPGDGEMYDHANLEGGAWWNDAPEPTDVDEDVEANEPGWTGIGAAWTGIGPARQCSSRSPADGVRCVRELSHASRYHMRDDLRWVSAEPTPDKLGGRCTATVPHEGGRIRCAHGAGHPPIDTGMGMGVMDHRGATRLGSFPFWRNDTADGATPHGAGPSEPAPADKMPAPKLLRVSDLPREVREVIGRILGEDEPCAHARECPLHGSQPAPDFTEPGGGDETGTPRVRILPLPTAPHNAPRFVLVVDREPAASDPVTREMWHRVQLGIGAATMILDSRSIDLPQVDGYAL